MYYRRFWRGLVIAVSLACGLNSTKALSEMVPYEDTVLFSNNHVELIELEFEPATSTGFTIEIADLEWLETPLSALSFSVFQGSGQIGSTVFDAAPTWFFLLGSDPVTVQVFAQTISPVTFGLFSVNITDGAVVPLPAGAWLFVSGFGLIIAAARRLRRSEGQIS